MSEEKMYMVKNDEGKYWDFGNSGFWRRDFPDCLTTSSRKHAGLLADGHGGHVVTLIEEPEKVVLTNEQAEIVEGSRVAIWPANYISKNTFSYDEKVLMNAYVNGYTVAKEKKYIVKVPHTDDSYFYKVDDDVCNAGDSFSVNFGDDIFWFTEAEIENYGLQGCERVEINTEDSNGK